MEKVIQLKEAIVLSGNLRSKGRAVVLTGGCFDILHIGHIRFLKKARQVGHHLFVALESDRNVQRRKGKTRPIHPQKDRAEILASLEFVDFVILLPDLRGFEAYLDLVKKISPHIIAVTEGDYHHRQKAQQAQEIGAQLLVVTPLLRTESTTKLTQLLEKEL